MSFILKCVLVIFIPIVLSDVYVYNSTNTVIVSFDDQTASFGPSFPSSGLKGYITTTNPLNACVPISPPPKISAGDYPWIALIPRTRGSDSCEFILKVKNAQKANFSAVIIYNYDDTLIAMGTSGTGARIPSTLITHTSGLTLISNYLYNNTVFNSTPIYHVKVVPEPSLPMIAYLVPLSVVLGISVVVLFVFVLAKLYIGRRRTRRNRLPRSALKQLKIKKFVKGDPWEVCAICLDDYEVGAKLRILPCDHAYHMKCIDPWLINNRRQCPVCKRYVFPNQENANEDANSGHQSTTATTEQTPLVRTNDDQSTVETETNQPLISVRRLFSGSRRRIQNPSFASNESSENDENLSSSQRSESTNHTTTVDLAFDRPSSNTRRYGSMHETLATPRVANFFVGSMSGATDNTNVSSRSIVEDVSDIEAANDESYPEIRSTRTCSEDNPAFVNDEESTIKANQTHL